MRALLLLLGCGAPGGPVVTFPASAVGAEREVLERQVARFEEAHPDVDVRLVATPDSADERHQLYVQWLNAGVGDPDVLQLDVIWVPEFAAAGWVRPVEVDEDAFFPGVIAADRYEGRTWAVPWFVDVGMLYWRTDLLDAPPTTLQEVDEIIVQAARYEGLVTVFLEVLGGFGGSLQDVDSPEAVAALTWLRDVITPEMLTWREEQARFAFERGEAPLMRNWPYAYALTELPVAVAPMPAAPGGRPTAALGGSHLAVNAHTEHPEAAAALVAFLTDPAQMRERAAVTGQLPPRPDLYDADLALPMPPEEALAVVRAARPRPVTPLWTELSSILQVRLHRALSGQQSPEEALRAAAAEMEAAARPPRVAEGARAAGAALAGAVALGALGVLALVGRTVLRARGEERLAWAMVGPAVGIVAAVAAFPLLWTFWESLRLHDLRMPDRTGFVGLAHYGAILADGRFWGALGHTGIFVGLTVTLELVLGIGLALLLDRGFRGRGLARATVLLPWALPTVVAALVWRFLLEGPWLAQVPEAWVPVILADVWKSTPFVALLALAGLQTLDDEVLAAARIDGAGAWSRFWHVVLPHLRPTLLVVLLFRTLDAFRVFDLIYVLTGGGPGTATEPVALYTFHALLQELRFGYGSALSVTVFLVTFALAMLYLRALGADLTRGPR